MDIFTLTDENGNLLHPVRQAATFAKYSRSPESARELVKKTDELSGAKFQEKWIVKFGHNSIAELATLPVAFEGVSIVASKAIEAWQRPGVSEKSTRMQEFSRDSLYVPDGVDPATYDAVMPLVDACYDLYEDMLSGEAASILKEVHNISDFQAARMAFDMARYLLPAGTKTNLGICAYPRDISQMISEFLGSFNPEFRQIGAALKEGTLELGGPLIRHTEPDHWVNRLPPPAVAKKFPFSVDDPVFLRRVNMSEDVFWDILRDRYGMKFRDLDRIMLERPEYHAAPFFFRQVKMHFDVYMDYGAFRDLQRHRRTDQYVEPLTPRYGFSTPPGYEDLGRKTKWSKFDKFSQTLHAFMQVRWPDEPVQQMLCQYFVPLAYIVGWHVDMDLQELYYLVELRTQEAGHPSYRDVSYRMWDEAEKVLPILTQWIRPRGPRP